MGSLRRRTNSGILSPAPTHTSGGGPLLDPQSNKRGLRGRVKIIALVGAFSVLAAMYFLGRRQSPANTATAGSHDQRNERHREMLGRQVDEDGHKPKQKLRTKTQKFPKKPPLGEGDERLEFGEDIREELARELEFKEDIMKEDYDYGYGYGGGDAGVNGDEGSDGGGDTGRNGDEGREDYGYGYRL